MAEYITEYCHFFTATNLEWKNLLRSDKYKDIVIESMRHLVINKKVIIYLWLRTNEQSPPAGRQDHHFVDVNKMIPNQPFL